MSTHVAVPLRRRFAVVAVAVSLALALVGCGSGSGTSSGNDTGDHNQADVTFATEMIPHHGQALVMVDMLRAHDVSTQLQQLGDDIEAAQKPEIDLMAGWLRAWGEDVPDTDGMGGGMDHMHGDDDGDAPGMMSDDDFADLDSAMGGDFEDMWLRMMIAHHEGAIEMARTEQADGQYQPAIDLAGRIIESQSAEIDLMEQMLAAD